MRRYKIVLEFSFLVQIFCYISKMAASGKSIDALRLVLYPDELTVHRLNRDVKIPPEIFSLNWFTISRTLEELSIIVPSTCTLLQDMSDRKEESGWRCMKIDSVLDFGLVGILASIVNPLKEVNIPVFVVSTFDTDYILINNTHVENAKKAIIEKTEYSIMDSEISLL